MTATVTCGLLLWVLALHWRETWWGWGSLTGAAVVSVAGVGWTRVYLGVHWPSDVLGGWLFGWCCVAVAVLGHRRLSAPRNPAAVPVGTGRDGGRA
jgi:undecaprenyl-diphosphatase